MMTIGKRKCCIEAAPETALRGRCPRERGRSLGLSLHRSCRLAARAASYTDFRTIRAEGAKEKHLEWSAATLWWVAAGVLVAAELATGTFYLLMLALGLAAAALAAHAGLGFSAQLVLGALIGGGAIVAWHVRRQRLGGSRPHAGRNFELDIGERVHVSRWEADGSARIDYRGASWEARYTGEGEPRPGLHVIRGVEANRLLLDR